MSKVKKGFKAFFTSLWEDFKGLCKSHLWRIFGFIVSVGVPVVWLIVNYCSKVQGNEKFVVPFAVILPLGILVLIYWGKLKNYLSTKVVMMKTENNIEKGKHAGAIILCDIVKAIFVVLPFLLIYLLIKGLERYVNNLSDIFLFMIICESVGGLFTIFDTIHNVIDYTDEEVEELEKEVIENKESK